MVPPPVLPPGKCAVHSPPFRRSTTAPGVSQVLKPSLVVNACHTAARDAGIVISRTSALSGTALLGAACLVVFSGLWAKAIAAVANRHRQRTLIWFPQ